MADVETRKKRIQELKGKIAAREAVKDRPPSDPELRKLRKGLRRAQRAVRKTVKLSAEEQAKRVQKLMDRVNVPLDVLTKTAKKPTGDPAVHSLRKRIKSLTRIQKHLARVQKKKAAPPAAPPPAS